MVLDPNQKKDRIETLKDILYSKEESNILNRKRHILKDKGEFHDAPTSWKDDEKTGIKIPFEKILLGSFIFFTLALGFAFYKFFGGSNVVSGDNIDIAVSGPVSVAGGEEFALDIKVKNNNDVNLQVVDMHVEYPDGTRNSDDLSQELKRYSELLGSIDVGGSEERIVKAVIFGEENTQKDINISVDYRIPGSNAVFNKEKKYTILVNSSPVNIKVTGADEINANQQVDFNIDITSNSLSIINGLILKIDYPFGFNVVSTKPASTVRDNSVFDLGDLEPGGKRNIKISGIVQGQDGEQRTLKFTVGTPQKDDEKVVNIPFAVLTKDLSLKKSFISVNTLFNELPGNEISIKNGSKVKSEINWINNLTEKIYNVSIKMKITGNALGENTVIVKDGFYDSFNNTITLDKNYIPSLAMLNPSDSGKINFEFDILTPIAKPQYSFSNSEIKADIVVTGSTIDNSNARSEVLFVDNKTIKISSDLKILSRGYRNSGPFKNTGPIPPKVDNESTYTITWTATDSFNNVKSVKASAFLPPYIKWVGISDPENEKINYNQDTREVTWDIGDMKMNTGDQYPAREVSFQISVIPSASQADSEINLLGEATISGTDSFSSERIGEIRQAVTTKITSDPEYFEGIGRVTN